MTGALEIRQWTWHLQPIESINTPGSPRVHVVSDFHLKGDTCFRIDSVVTEWNDHASEVCSIVYWQNDTIHILLGYQGEGLMHTIRALFWCSADTCWNGATGQYLRQISFRHYSESNITYVRCHPFSLTRNYQYCTFIEVYTDVKSHSSTFVAGSDIQQVPVHFNNEKQSEWYTFQEAIYFNIHCTNSFWCGHEQYCRQRFSYNLLSQHHLTYLQFVTIINLSLLYKRISFYSILSLPLQDLTDWL